MTTSGSPKTRRIAMVVHVLCGLVFTLFIFLYLYKTQAGLLGMAQHVYSNGSMVYSPLMGALIVSAVLWLIQWQFSRLFKKLNIRYYALTYFPSCMLLVALINFCAMAYGMSSYRYWWWLAGLAGAYLIIMLLLVTVQRKKRRYDFDGDTPNFFIALWPNTLIMAALLAFVGGCGSTQDTIRYTLEAQEDIVNHDYEAALNVGETSQATSRELSAFRAYALSRQGMLGESLFEYPQHDKSNGLLLPRRDSARFVFPPDSVYIYLGAVPCQKQDVQQYLAAMKVRFDLAKPSFKDYWLCSLLLDKKLDDFARELPQYYTVNDSLPKHYREALTLYVHTRTTPCVVFQNKVDEANYSDFQRLSGLHQTAAEKANYTRREFGNTYYWYWHYQL